MDKRLARNVTYNIQGETLVKERLWTPHLYIVNEHDSRIMGSSSQDVLVTVMPDGTVLYSTRCVDNQIVKCVFIYFTFISPLSPSQVLKGPNDKKGQEYVNVLQKIYLFMIQ